MTNNTNDKNDEEFPVFCIWCGKDDFKTPRFTELKKHLKKEHSIGKK